MDKTIFTFEMPLIDGEVAASLQEFLYALIDAFNEQYHYQIEHYYEQIRNTANTPCNIEPSNDQNPF